MAYLFLKAQGLAGKLVADIRIDGAGKKVTRSDNCRVSDLSVSSDNLTFTYEAKSLPYPIDTSYYDNEKHTQADALSVIPFMDEMNYERFVGWILRVDDRWGVYRSFYGEGVGARHQYGSSSEYPAV